MEVKKLIITIDDDPEINQLLSRYISNLGYKILTSTTPREFLSLCEKNKPDLCIVDVELGEAGSGLILLESLRKSFGPLLPIFVLSRHDDAEKISKALEGGATDYLHKPPTKERLQHLLDRYAPLTDEELVPTTPLRKVPTQQAPSELSFPLEWISIDERGLWLRSKHLISRGSVFYFQHPEFDKISKRTAPVLLTVAENPIESGLPNETFKIYGTFDTSDQPLMNHVRNWLISKVK